MCIRGLWVSVCHDYWNNRHTDVVCNQLGQNGCALTSCTAIVNILDINFIYTASYILRDYGSPNEKNGFYLVAFDLFCFGHENKLVDCDHRRAFDITHSCRPGIKEAAVTCTSKLIHHYKDYASWVFNACVMLFTFNYRTLYLCYVECTPTLLHHYNLCTGTRCKDGILFSWWVVTIL